MKYYAKAKLPKYLIREVNIAMRDLGANGQSFYDGCEWLYGLLMENAGEGGTLIEEYFGAKFLRTKFSGIDGRTIVTFQEQTGKDNPFEIRLTPSGMSFSGKLEKEISSMDELQDWARLISACWGEHERLRPKITKSFAGH